ncbi:MAG: hypothetical protein KJ563_02370, partial [Candidatus Thermoplasmatota archaeon]|nr:hypothetical protein [Candidatus Thermoplasmatota archaeon]
ANPFRFSTKYFDAEIDYADTDNDGLYYYGYRYYSPRLGRWLKRDPIGERGGANLYGSLRNTPPSVVDSDGRQPLVLGEPPRRCELPSQDVTPLHDEPPDCFPAYPDHTVPAANHEITTRPGWWWLRNPGCGKKFDYPVDCDWAQTALSWPRTRTNKTSLLGSLTRSLSLACVDCDKTGRPCDAGPPIRTVSDSQEVTFNTEGADWFHAGIVRLKYTATCNMNVLCANCNASCSITWQIWDGWHWGADPALPESCAGGPYEFNWYITWYESVAISVPCRKSTEE